MTVLATENIRLLGDSAIQWTHYTTTDLSIIHWNIKLLQIIVLSTESIILLQMNVLSTENKTTTDYSIIHWTHYTTTD